MKSYHVAIALLLLLVLCGCKPAPVVSDCPTLATYTKSQQQQMAAELRMLPPQAAVHKALLEWASLRAQLKKCQP